MKRRTFAIVLTAVLAAALLFSLAGCGLKKKNTGKERVDGKTVTVNGVRVKFDQRDNLEKKISFLTSSDLQWSYSTLSGMRYSIPKEGEGSGNPIVDSVFYMNISSQSYHSLEQQLNALNTEPEQFSGVTVTEKTINGAVWTRADYIRRVTDPEADLSFHQYMLEHDFDGTTELVIVNFIHTDEIAEFEEEFMNSVTFLK